MPLREYATSWPAQHPGLRRRTVELYESELRLHILPALGDVAIGELTVGRVRTWRSTMLATGSPGPSTVAKCYRLLRAILNTAVEDEVIARNPCVIKGAGVERARTWAVESAGGLGRAPSGLAHPNSSST